MAERDSDDQSDELMALASIYDDAMFKMQKAKDQLNTGTLSAHIELSNPFHVKLNSQSHDIKHEVHHLPPIVLSFTLPVDYPSSSPPQYSLHCIWLTNDQIKNVRNQLDELWNTSQGSVILFLWMSFLMNDLLEHLSITSPLFVGADVLTAVVDNDQVMRKNVFAATSFTCEVCFADKLGASCTRFEDCGHVFCQSCVRDFFELHISEGSVAFLKCLSPKCLSTAIPSQVKSLVSAELFERYDRLLLQRSLDMMIDVVYCPRKDCMCPVLVDEKYAMGSCPSCRYVFCTFCKMVYHGISPCKIASEKFVELREQYMAANEFGKRELELRYGRQNLVRAIEESCSQEWVQDNCKKCPQCRTQIEKKDGCNKMTCTKCHAYFCWLCLTLITHKDPYSHFNSTVSPCFNKLFVGVDTDDQDFDDF